MPGGGEFHEELGVTSESTFEEIRRAYLKQCLKHHPDKNRNDDASKRKFQQLQRAYDILGDKDKRREYEEHGVTGDEDEESEVATAATRAFKKYAQRTKEVTEDDIRKFEKEYRGSEEEEEDVKRNYTRFNGDMAKAMECILCCDDAVDSHRFADIIDAAIESNEVDPSSKYTQWRRRVRKRRAPLDPLGDRGQNEEEREEGRMSALVAQLGQRQQERSGDIISNLERRFAKPGREKAEPSDEEFNRIQANLRKRRRR